MDSSLYEPVIEISQVWLLIGTCIISKRKWWAISLDWAPIILLGKEYDRMENSCYKRNDCILVERMRVVTTIIVTKGKWLQWRFIVMKSWLYCCYVKPQDNNNCDSSENE